MTMTSYETSAAAAAEVRTRSGRSR